MEHPDEVFGFAERFGRGRARKHVEMFSNRDTLGLPEDVREGLRAMFDRAADLDLARPLSTFEVIDP